MYVPLDKKFLQTTLNHPVHILNNKGDFSPSAFIPFCSFGDEFIGAKINGFDLPVCDIFKERNVYDQICYETDLQELKSKDSQRLGKQLGKGLLLVLDYNEERQMFNYNSKIQSIEMNDFDGDEDSFTIHLDSKSKTHKSFIGFLLSILTASFLDPTVLYGEGQYGFNNLKEIYVTDSFLDLDQNIRKCHLIDTFDDCKTNLHIVNLRNHCGCLPISSLFNKVKKSVSNPI